MTHPKSVSKSIAPHNKHFKRSVEPTLVRAQAAAGALFFVFLVLHLSNTVVAVFGADSYNAYQRVIRQIYQHPVLEVLLVIAPLITHVVAGFWLYILRKKRKSTRPLKYRLQTGAGFFLLLVVFGHMLATRGISYWYGTVAEFSGVAFSLWWVPEYFYPYYFLLFMAGLYHGSMGAITLLTRAQVLTPSTSYLMPLLLGTAGSAAALAALLSFGGVVFEISDPRDNDYARQYSKLLDVDLSRPR